jgi:hypothetical protein
VKRSALHPVAALGCRRFVLYMFWRDAEHFTGLPPAGLTLNRSGTTAPAAVHSVKIPADWGHGKTASAVDV